MDNTRQTQLIYLLDRIANALEKIAGIEHKEGDEEDGSGNN